MGLLRCRHIALCRQVARRLPENYGVTEGAPGSFFEPGSWGWVAECRSRRFCVCQFRANQNTVRTASPA